MKTEHFARFIVVVLVIGISVTALLYRLFHNDEMIVVHAAMPDHGGWQSPDLHAQTDQPLQLRLVSDDVVHSFALGKSSFEPVDLYPGKQVELTLTFDEPGVYTFYCTRWCGADHWRMRGTITVGDGDPESDHAPDPPLYVELGIDLDAPRKLQGHAPVRIPSAGKGSNLAVNIPPDYFSEEYYRSHSPDQVWRALRSDPVTNKLSDSQVWDLVARIWWINMESADLVEGEALYRRDCAACHGENGKGDGVFSGEWYGDYDSPHDSELDNHLSGSPVDFQDKDHMLSASPALLQGKILRGGMGTGMPSWGFIFTENQTWSLVSYLWTFLFSK